MAKRDLRGRTIWSPFTKSDSVFRPCEESLAGLIGQIGRRFGGPGIRFADEKGLREMEIETNEAILESTKQTNENLRQINKGLADLIDILEKH